MADSDSDERLRLTPEQRRFLGGSRSINPQAPSEQKAPRPEPVPKPKSAPGPPPPEASQLPEQRAQRRARGGGGGKVMEVQKLALIAGALILLAAVFYVGKKFEYWRYLIETRNEAKIAAQATGEFKGASAEELIEHALMDEQLGHWQDAAKRLIAAKYKNISLGGILFYAAKLYYDHSDFHSADRLFESAIGFG